VKLPAGWRAAIDSLCDDAKPFEDSCFRSVELAWAHPDDVISGQGTKARGGRFAGKGTRAVYASIDEETATHEVTARKTRLGGKAQISLKDYPRLMYVVSIEAKRCLDFRKVGNDAVLKETLRAAVDPDDLAASQEVGDYLAGKEIDAIIFPSVVCEGANIVVFRDAVPPPKVEIKNRDEILNTIQNIAKRIPK
jgi:RES domain-containing protein